MLGNPCYLCSFKTSLDLKLSKEKDICFLHKLRALFQHLGTGTYIYLYETDFLYKCQHDFHHQDNVMKTNGQSFKFIIKLRNLVAIKKQEHRNSYLSQITYVTVLTIIFTNSLNKDFLSAIKIYFSMFFFYV